MVGRYAKEYDLQIQTTAFPDGRELVQNYHKFDILLMDIEMPHLNGMEAAQKIRELDKEVVIVFITNMAQYAIKGYEVDALDFILKPLNYYTFSMRFTRAVGRVKNREGKRICLNLPDGAKFLDSREIYYVEIQNRMLHYHTKRSIYDSRSIKGRAGRAGRLAFCKMQSVLSGKFEVCFRNQKKHCGCGWR